MSSTITVPDAVDLNALAAEVATDQAERGDFDARMANAIRDLATEAKADIEALQAGTSIADATASAKGIVQLAGDLGGTGTAAATPRVGRINSATVPAGGSLTTGNVLQVSGASELSYGAVNLAGGANCVTGVLPGTNMVASSASVPGSMSAADKTKLDSVQAGTVTLVDGTKTVNAGITVTASSQVFTSLITPGAGVSGTRYKVASSAGAPGVGSITITAVDSGAGDNIVNTDVSVLAYLIVG